MKRSIYLRVNLFTTQLLAACSQAGTSSLPTLPAITPTLPAITPTPMDGGQDSGGMPAAVEKARAELASRLGIDVEAIQVNSIEEMDWPNSCLGAPDQNEMCSEVITPGFGGLMTASGVQYEFRTDRSGDILRFIPATTIPQNSFLQWQSQDGECYEAVFSQDYLEFAKCGESLEQEKYPTPERSGDALYYLGTFAPFEADTPAGSIAFQGIGSQTASPAEQRMIAEWASLVFKETAFGRANPSLGMALSWHREGGLAGFCDDVMVYVTGEVYASSCKGALTGEPVRFRLNAQELEKLYSWMDNLASFQDSYADPAQVDAISMQLVFAGNGSESPSVGQKDDMVNYASALYAEAAKRTTPASEQDSAQMALANYFLALWEGDYAKAIGYYGGSYEVLAGYNPDIPADDHLALFRRGCEQNGLICNITVGNVVEVQQLDENTYRLTVQFQDREGQLFHIGPFEGENPATEISRFDYTVVKKDGQFLVQDLPPYVP